MTKTKDVAPQTKCSEVELEEGFMKASIVDEDKQDQPTIAITDQGGGAESDYFTNDSKWDF